MEFFDKKLEQIQKDYKNHLIIMKSYIDKAIAQLEERKALYKLFQHQLSERSIKQIVEGHGCVLCFRNIKLCDYAKGYIINNELYCDEHGDLMLHHRPLHKQAVSGCDKCAILDCLFRHSNHNVDLGDDGCDDCREAV